MMYSFRQLIASFNMMVADSNSSLHEQTILFLKYKLPVCEIKKIKVFPSLDNFKCKNVKNLQISSYNSKLLLQSSKVDLKTTGMATKVFHLFHLDFSGLPEDPGDINSIHKSYFSSKTVSNYGQ